VDRGAMKHYHHLFRAESQKFHETHLERILSLAPFPYYWTWSIIGFMFFLISTFISLFYEKSLTFVYVFLVLSILLACQGTVITWAHNKMILFRDTFIEIVDEDHFEIADKYEKQLRIIFNDRGMFISAIALIALAHVTKIDYHEFSFHSIFTNTFINLFYYLTVYILGAGLYVMIMTAWGVHRIGHYSLHVSALFTTTIRSLGILYSKFTILACIIYIIWGIFHALVPPKFSSLQLVIWFGSFAILLIAYFVLPQYSIHQMMVRIKTEKIKTFSPLLRCAAVAAFQSPIDENVSTLKVLLDTQHQIDKMSDWPFSFYEILHIALLITIPLIVVTLEVLLGVVK
jgi:hypothetical protein